MNKVYRINIGEEWFTHFGMNDAPETSTDITEAKIMLYGEADRVAEKINGKGLEAKIVEVK